DLRNRLLDELEGIGGDPPLGPAAQDEPAIRIGHVPTLPGGVSSRCPDRRLRRRDAGDRYARRRGRHVVETSSVEERDRVRVAAVLAAHAQLEPWMRFASDPRSQPYQPAHTGLVDR